MKKAENVLILALDERWKKYRVELKTCQREFSQEAVHDLRVATRRLLAVLEMLRAIAPHPRVKKARRMLKDQLDALDDLRDTQVMLVEVSESAADLPELQSFQEYLLKREKRLLRAARKAIRALEVAGLKQRLDKSRAALEENTPGRKWTASLLSAVDQAYVRAQQVFGEIEAADSASIHRFRVAFKKFRYMVEIVHPGMAGYPEALLKQMHEYQSRMGDVQDAEVFLRSLTEFAEGAEPPLVTALAWFEGRRAELIARFMAGRGQLSVFWRETPEAKFHWEMEHEPVHRSTRDRRGGGLQRVRGRQPASADRQGPEENGEDRPRPAGAGDHAGPGADQSGSARRADGEDPA
jgi:CHAD domain-containing protein